MPTPRPFLVATIALLSLVSAACSSESDTDTGADPTGPAVVGDGPSSDGSSSDDAAGATDGTRVAADVCEAMDPAAIEEQVAPVDEVQTVDETICNVVLDVEGLGSMLSVEVHQPTAPGQDAARLFDGVLAADEATYGTAPDVVDGLGDAAASSEVSGGARLIVLADGQVVSFTPHLDDVQVTVDHWRPIIESALG